MAPKNNYNKANYQKNQNLKQTGPKQPEAQVTRTKTDGRIGSATPPAFLKGGSGSVNNNKKAGPSGNLGVQAMQHMSPSHEGGKHWSPRVAKSRAQAAAGRAAQSRPHTEPINVARGVLKHQKPE